MATGSRFRPSGQHELGPAGKISRLNANLEAIRVLRVIGEEDRPATPGEQAILARWSAWGAVPQVFDERKDEYAEHRAQLRAMLSEDEYAAARRTTINAHYTDAALVRTVWDAVAGLGFDGGTVLEPGCGSGNFIGFAPPSARMLGVELDPVTARIAAALYPEAEIRSESFADTRLPEGGFDLVIGNVPFGQVTPTDEKYNPGSTLNIHNYFLVKSLHLTRPGGLVAALTSRYTLDKEDDSARTQMADLADLVTAIRLPTGAHAKAAGTDAVTDLLIFRRREDGRPPADTSWKQSLLTELDGGAKWVSEYFTSRPDNVIGQLAVGSGLYAADEVIVRPRDLAAVPDELAARLAVAVSDAHENGLAMAPRPDWMPSADVRAGAGRVRLGIPARDASRFEGTITAHGDGTFSVLRDGQSEPWPCPDSQAAELRALLRLRDTVSSLLDAERASSQDTPRLGELRQRLNREYDAYAAAYGPLNRTSWRRTGRTDEDGNDTWARQAPGQGKFKDDPYAATVYALESFDLETGVALKAPIFTQRVIADRQPAESAGSPADAIAICMDADGQVRLERAARLLGSASQEEARAALGELVYDEPETGRLVPAAEYLSGKVRDKLAAAGKAAETDPKFTVNVTALRKVLPADLGPGEIDARLGASWIPPTYIQQGLREILQDRTLTVVKGYGSSWQVKGNTHSLEARDVYGTADKDAIALAQCLLEQRPIKVSYSMDDLTPAEKERLSSARGREDMAAFMRQRAAAATVAARGKADELSDRFSEWLWGDKTRTAELTRTYNEKFNSLVLRSYDDARPRLPGLAEWFNPHPHQYAAVARIVNEPAALLAHEVGAGKTAEMAMGCMELRRLGLVSKPAIIVPNHMLEQFQREFLQLYPQARVLACGAKDLQKNRRRTFVARIATGDWDAVIMSRSVFERIPMSAAEQERYIKAKLVAYDRWLERAAIESEDTRMVKRMEKQRLSFEERLKRKLSRARDAGMSWEQTGIDYLLVDEAHGYKNLDTRSNSPALDIDGSARAADLEMKLDCLRRENGQRIVTFATATPIANSMTEAYVMLSYLRPDLLKDAGIDDFDGWAGSFTSTSTDVEVAPEGGLRVKERVSRFRNLPELLLMWRVVADVKTAEDLNLPVPDLAGGKPEVVTVPPSGELRSFMMTLASRAEEVRTGRVEPKEDNMLKISSDGRAAALDLRLAGLDPPAEEGKLDIAAGRIARIYRDTRDSTYTDRDGNPEPGTGSLQIVFCELGTPTGSGKFGVYEYLKAQLADRGVPAGQVRFMHEAKNDKEKAALFAAARAGNVSVLIGTTELMGVGTNVQKRAVALHHLDCPWRPADVAQREGRILRQGNQNPQVQIIRYVTEGSFDAYMWQTVLRKAKFIAQVMHGRLDSREIEDIGGSEALSYSEVTALATGDMRILLKAKADAEVQRLIKLETSWKRSKRHLKTRIADGQRDIPRLQANAARLEAAIGQRTPMKGDAFRCELNGKHLTKRADAAAELQAVIAREHHRAVSTSRAEREAVGPTPVGTFGGLSLEAKGGVDSFGSYVDLRFPGVPNGSVRTRPGDSELGIVTKLENKLSGFDALLADTRQQITDTEAEIKRAKASLDAPFAKATELARARYESDRLTAELGGQQVLPQEPEAHETPVANAEAERDSDDDDDNAASEGQNETWDDAADAGADLDENPLEEAGFTSDADDEWDGQPGDDVSESAATEASGTEPVPDPADETTEPATASEPASAASSPASGQEPPTEPVSTPVSRDAETAPEPEAPPAGTVPVEAHRGWDGAVRPERLVYTDGTLVMALRINSDGDDEMAPATAVGGRLYGAGCMQIVRWDDGGYGTVHPAVVTPRGIDPYAGLSDRDRARWATFDRYEARYRAPAYIPAKLVSAGDILTGVPAPRGRQESKVSAASTDTRSYAPVCNITVWGMKHPLEYSPDQLVGVDIPENHPTLAATIEAITGSQANQPAQPRDDTPAREDPARARERSTSSQKNRESAPGASADPAQVPAPDRDSTVTAAPPQAVPETPSSLSVPGSSPASPSAAPGVTAPAASGGFRPTLEQQAIIDACVTGQNLVIEAGAGSGKTSTLRLASTSMKGRRGLYVAYNRAIADEAGRSFPANVSCSTAHSLAFRALGRRYAHRLDGKRLPSHEIARLLGIREPLQVSEEVLLPPDQLAQIAMGTVKMFCRSADPALSIHHVPGVNGVVGPAHRQLAWAILPCAVAAWEDLQRLDGRLTFTADHYLKMWQLTRPRLGADFVLFDEAQDANPVIADIVQGQQSTQLIAVGDSCQAINGWNGAIDALATWPADQRLYLSQSFRFGTAIADEANKWLENLDASLRIKGTDRIQSAVGAVTAPDAVLCRTNATGVAQALALLEDGKRVALVGGGNDIKRLAEAARELQLSGYTNHPELAAFRSWGAVVRYVESDESGSDLRTFVRLVESHGPGNVIRVVNQLVSEDHADITVSTAHKSKGREWDRVKIADDFREPAADKTAAGTGPIPRADAMLAYVAVTRAKITLDRGSLEWIDSYSSRETEPSSASTSRTPREQAAVTIPPAGQQEQASTAPVPSTDAPASSAASESAAEPGSPVRASAAAPASPPAPAPASTESAPGDATTIRIEHDDEGTRVYGTDKSQKPIIKALKDQGFKWSRKQGYWYLNRTWRRDTREDRVRRLMDALNDLGIVPDSRAPQTTTSPEQAAGQPIEPHADRGSRKAHAGSAPPASASSSESKPEPAAEDAGTGASTSADTASPGSPESTARPVPARAGKSSGYEQDSLFGTPGGSSETIAPATAGTSAKPGPKAAASAQPGSRPSAADASPAGSAPAVPGEPQESVSGADLPADGQAGESSATAVPAPSATAPDARETTATPASGQDPASTAPTSARPEAPVPVQAPVPSSLADIPVDPRPYWAGRHQADSGSRIIESDYGNWLGTRQQPSDSRLPKEHPRVQQLIVRWKAVHTKGISDGPGPSAARYHALAHAALALAAATDRTNHPREHDTLSRLATDARKFSVRLRATAERNFSSSDKASMYRGGREQAERGSRMVEADFRAWSRTGAPPEAARDLNLWEQARRAELAWHAIRRSGLHDGPGPSAARYRELADATRELADGFSVSLPSTALLPLQQLADHARKHAIRLETTENARTKLNGSRVKESGYDKARPDGGDAYGALPSELAAITRSAYAAQHRSPDQHDTPAPDHLPTSRTAAFARQVTRNERE